MRFAIQLCGLMIGLPLQILIIATLLRSGYRRFPFLFAYIVGDFLTTVVDVPSAVGYRRGMQWAAFAFPLFIGSTQWLCRFWSMRWS